ncbi:hypothetical protein ACVNP1_12765 [Staphylococcus aureus]
MPTWRAIAKAMVNSKHTALMTLMDEIDVQALWISNGKKFNKSQLKKVLS